MKNDLKNDKKKKMVGERAEQREITKDRSAQSDETISRHSMQRAKK